MKHLLLTLCLLLLASPAWAVLARDADCQNLKAAAGTTLDLTCTATGTTTDGLLWLGCAVTTSGATTITGANWDQGGTPVALIQHVTLDATPSLRLDIWYLKLPSTGTKTLRVTTSAGQITMCHAVTYTGVDQTTPLGTAVTHDLVSGTELTVNVTSAAGNLVLEISGYVDSPLTQTLGGGQTLIGTEQADDPGNREERVSEEAGAGTVTMNETWTGALGGAMIGVSVNAAASTRRAVAPILFQ